MTIAWGNRVSSEFVEQVVAISDNLQIDPSWLMACMAFETGRTFSASVVNGAGSGAVGLIQFMPATAQALGTTTENLAEMSNEAQLEYVEAYFQNLAGRLSSLSDLYMAILWPSAIGQDEDYVLFDQSDPRHPRRYIQNAGLDFNRDGLITKAEASARVQELLEEGLQPPNVLEN